jgi:polyhydroxyalkanoate synthesis regulator phasin
MDDETRTAFATMAESMAAGFARMDRYFEFQQAQHIEFRTREVLDLRRDVRQLRDVTKESETDVRRDLDQLTNRVERLDERLDDLRR